MTDRLRELPCDPEVENTEACHIFRKLGKCGMNVHHHYHPRRKYTSKVEKDFREHPDNKTRMCMDEHRKEHLKNNPPRKPSRDEMLAKLALKE